MKNGQSYILLASGISWVLIRLVNDGSVRLVSLGVQILAAMSPGIDREREASHAVYRVRCNLFGLEVCMNFPVAKLNVRVEGEHAKFNEDRKG